MINYDHKVVPTCIQSYKASTLVNYDSRVVSIINLLVIATLDLYFMNTMFVRLATGIR